MNEYKPSFETLVEYLSSYPGTVYLVGGGLRDLLLHRQNPDIDFVVTGDSLLLSRKLADRLDAGFFVLDEERLVGRVVYKHDVDIRTIDISPMRGLSVEDDLKKRDFTINAMAIDINDIKLSEDLIPNIIDPTGGLDHLKRKSIQAVAGGIFEDDPIRMIRAFRIAGDLGFSISTETLELIKKDNHLIDKVAHERVQTELVHILDNHNSALILSKMKETGVLESILTVMVKSQSWHGNINEYWSYTLDLLKNLELLIGEKNIKRYFSGLSSEIAGHLSTSVQYGIKRISCLKLAVILSVFGPSVDEIEERADKPNGVDDNHGETVDLKRVLKRMRFSKRTVQVVNQIANLQWSAYSLIQSAKPDQDDVYGFIMQCREESIEVVLFGLSHLLTSNNQTKGVAMSVDIVDSSVSILKRCLEVKSYNENNPSLITGYDLKKDLGLKPGPVYRGILENIRYAQISGIIKNRKQALSYAKEMLSDFKT